MRTSKNRVISVFALLQLLLGTALAQGLVLCIGADGDHVAVEAVHADAGCPDTDETGSRREAPCEDAPASTIHAVLAAASDAQFDPTTVLVAVVELPIDGPELAVARGRSHDTRPTETTLSVRLLRTVLIRV